MPTVRVDDVELYHELHGDSSRPALVFVNGIFQDTTAWSLHVRRLGGSYRCVVYDCRGQGQSAKPPGPYQTERHADDLRGLLDALGIPRAHVLGLSNGGAVAITFAAACPDRVDRLVLVDTFAHVDGALRAKLRSWRLAVEAGGPGLRFDVSVPWNFSAAFLEQHEHELTPLRERATKMSAAAIRDLILGASEFDGRPALARIRAPTLILVGDEDVLAPVWCAREIARGIAGSRLEIVEGAGHALPVERLERFCSLVRAFLG
jgi:3-oxoadipate enol-lactonase